MPRLWGRVQLERPRRLATPLSGVRKDGVATAREFTARIAITNPVTARAMIQLLAGATQPLVLIDAQITQRDSATSAQLGVQLARMSAAATVTAMVLATHIPRMSLGDSQPLVQLGTSGTGHTGSTAGTQSDLLLEEGWNTLSGWFYMPVPEKRITVPAAGLVALILTGTVPAGVYTAAITFAEDITG